MANGEKTIKVSATGYQAMMDMRRLLSDHGFDALPPEFAELAREEVATFNGDDAFPRAAVQSIAGRIGLAVMNAHLGVEPTKKSKR